MSAVGELRPPVRAGLVGGGIVTTLLTILEDRWDIVLSAGEVGLATTIGAAILGYVAPNLPGTVAKVRDVLNSDELAEILQRIADKQK